MKQVIKLRWDDNFSQFKSKCGLLALCSDLVEVLNLPRSTVMDRRATVVLQISTKPFDNSTALVIKRGPKWFVWRPEDDDSYMHDFLATSNPWFFDHPLFGKFEVGQSVTIYVAAMQIKLDPIPNVSFTSPILRWSAEDGLYINTGASMYLCPDLEAALGVRKFSKAAFRFSTRPLGQPQKCIWIGMSDSCMYWSSKEPKFESNVYSYTEVPDEVILFLQTKKRAYKLLEDNTDTFIKFYVQMVK